MALPKLNIIKHNLTLPSTGKKITFRPFLVKEEKILMMAMESGEATDMIHALRDIITSCVEEDIKVNTLPMFDIEYIFLQLRSRSVGEKTPITYSLENDNCEKVKGANCSYLVEINLDEVQVEKNKDHKDIIDLTKDIKIKMKYPQIEASAEIMGLEGEKLIDKTFEMIGGCMEYIMEGEEMHQTSDYSQKEIDDFLNSLSSPQFREIQKFFDTMPKLRKEVTAKCSECGKENKRVLEGLGDFFV
jgi:hypothetical protein